MYPNLACRCGHQIAPPAAARQIDNIYSKHISDNRPNCGSAENCSFHMKDELRASNSETVLNPTPQLLCQSCAMHILSSRSLRRYAASEQHYQKQSECQQRLLKTRHYFVTNERSNDSSARPLPDPNKITQQVLLLKEHLDLLRNRSNDLAIRVTAITMENDDREERLEAESERLRLARRRLESVKQSLLFRSSQTQHTPNSIAKRQNEESCQSNPDVFLNSEDGAGGELRNTLIFGTHRTQSIRFLFALRVFDMHRVDVGERYTNFKKETISTNQGNTCSLTGVGKISGLPLPHAGPALYGVLPSGVLASSLRLVASLTKLVARCLGVVLPHPILLSSKECACHDSGQSFDGDISDMEQFDDLVDSEHGSPNVVSFYHDHKPREMITIGRSKAPVPTPRSHQYLQQLPLPKSSRETSSAKTRATESIRHPLLQTTKSSLLSFVGSSARKAIAIATGSSTTYVHDTAILGNHTGQNISTTHSQSTKLQFSTKRYEAHAAISKQIYHTSYAVLQESYEFGAAEYVLSPPRWKEKGEHVNLANSANHGDSDLVGPNSSSACHNKITHSCPYPLSNSPCQQSPSHTQSFSSRDDFRLAEERFATGLQLLQNDVVALCFRAGVDVLTLWPAESLLLNLHALWLHCRDMVVNVG